MSNLKAWHCGIGDDNEFSLLVFAETRNRARKMAADAYWNYWHCVDYVDMWAKRAAPQFDDYADRERVIETNDELPDGAPFRGYFKS
ncbi:MAG: hypothetical protein KDK05_10370 [Candidatus Competibacteraceae bacterium]|nr:hypothetical protein [Candidatus Competibacteraceae bacterium]